ncbi:MAG: hypothetical protein H6809_03695 [Phycisphaeraceae bacterium]|nr:hypothetical protein [Phycisphaeraceae bacterium]
MIVRGWSIPTHDAEDIVQQVACNASRWLAKNLGAKLEIPLVVCFARRRTVEYWRRRAARRSERFDHHALEDEGDAGRPCHPPTDPFAELNVARMADLLDGLDEQILDELNRWARGQTSRQIGESLGKKENTVTTRRLRAFESIRARVREDRARPDEPGAPRQRPAA